VPRVQSRERTACEPWVMSRLLLGEPLYDGDGISVRTLRRLQQSDRVVSEPSPLTRQVVVKEFKQGEGGSELGECARPRARGAAALVERVEGVTAGLTGSAHRRARVPSMRRVHGEHAVCGRAQREKSGAVWARGLRVS
jgi:hypothetical protein